MVSVTELYNKYSKAELLEMCDNKGVDCKKSWNKTQLAEALVAKMGKKKKSADRKSSKKRSSKKTRSRRKSKKRSGRSRRKSKTRTSRSRRKSKKRTKSSSKSSLDCDIDSKTCEKSTKYKKADIVALAQKCGVDTSGTRKDICARIIAAAGGAGKAPSPAPSPVPSPVPSPSPTSLPTTADLLKQKSKDDLLKMCEQRRVECKKSWNKTKIAQTIRGAAKKPTPKPPSPKSPSPRPPSPRPDNKEAQLLLDEIDAFLDDNLPVGESEMSRNIIKDQIFYLLFAMLDEIRAGEVSPESLPEEEDLNAEGIPFSPEELYDGIIINLENQGPSPKSPSPKAPSPAKCFGGNTYDELINKKVTELRQLLADAGVTQGRPIKKDQMAQYLCDLAQNGRCNPEKGQFCEGDYVCDASNEEGVCISPELANERGLEEMFMPDGRRIIGTKKALAALQKRMTQGKAPTPAKQPSPIPTPPKQPTPPMVKTPTPPMAKAPTPRPQKVKTPTPPKDPTPKPPEGTEVTDIEEILRQIQQGDGEQISELAATQSAVLKCLGLLA